MWIYNVLLLGVGVFLSPFLLLKVLLKKNKYWEGLPERLGVISANKWKQLEGKKGPTVWFHAVSVGEASAAYPLYQSFKKSFPSYRIVFSTTTKTGQEWIRSRLHADDVAIYLPLDFPWIIRKVLRRVQPKALLVMETEIWPNLWWLAARQGVHIALMNARLSGRSYRRYRWARFFFKRVLNLATFISTQSKEESERFKGLGVDPAKVFKGGNLKFEASLLMHEFGEKTTELKRRWGINESDFVFVGGSTHEGEEALLIDIYQQLVSLFPMLKLVLVPRHPDRADQIEAMAKERNLDCLRDSEDNQEAVLSSSAIILVDRVGRLPLYYSLATLVFVGKSLTAHGGQNVLEPAAQGKVVLFGPHMENFRDISSLLLKGKGAMCVKHKDELQEVVERFLRSKEMRSEISRNAQQIVKANCGAMQINLEAIDKKILRVHG